MTPGGQGSEASLSNSRRNAATSKLSAGNASDLLPPETRAISGLPEIEDYLLPQWRDVLTSDSFTYYDRLNRVDAFVDEHLKRHLTLRDVASVACCDYHYLSAYFHQYVGIRFSDWLRLKRVAEAARMFRKRHLHVAIVAAEVGFKNRRALERAFRKYCGITPSEFRTKCCPNRALSVDRKS